MEIKSKDIQLVSPEKIKKITSIQTDQDFYVSDKGVVYNSKMEKICHRRGGYKKKYIRASLRVNKKPKDFFVHRLVLLEFVGNPAKGLQCSQKRIEQTRNCKNAK